MTSHRQPKATRKLPRLFYRWHRRIGASAALFLIWIVISGWLLNHSDSLNLAQRQLHSPALANWYHLSYQVPTTIFSNTNHWLASSGETLLWDAKPLSVKLSSPVGFFQSENIIAIANNDDLVLLNPQSELIDKLNSSSLPLKHISKIGSGCNGIAISDDIHIFTSQDGLDWQSCEQNISWSKAQAITAAQLTQIELLLVPEISVEKVLVDLHTGRFFGRYGAYVVDLVGGCLLLLALSGFWLFLRSATKGKK